MHTIKAPLTKAGVRQILEELAGITALSYPEIAKCSGVHFTTIYNILREEPGGSKKLVRPSTVRKIAESLGFNIKINKTGNEIILRQVGDTIKSKLHRPAVRDPLESFARDIVEWLRSIGKTKLTSEEKKKVRDMLRILLK